MLGSDLGLAFLSLGTMKVLNSPDCSGRVAPESQQALSIAPVWCLVVWLETPDLLTFTFILRTLVMCVYEPFYYYGLSQP